MSVRSGLPVAIIGAGPVGLAAAAHLIARGMEPVVLEAGRGGCAAHAARVRSLQGATFGRRRRIHGESLGRSGRHIGESNPAQP
jgi:thioredoxin reductase